MEKKFDIIVTTCNSEENIRGILDSIKKQSYKKFDCYVVDDDSKDSTVDIIKKEYPWVNLLQQKKNNGPAKNRNIAISKGANPYIVTFDDDVYLKDSSWLNKALVIMDDNPRIGQISTRVMSGFNEDIILDCGIMQNKLGFGGIYYSLNEKDVLNKHKTPRLVLGACTAGSIIRRNVFDKVRGFDPKYFYLYDDLDLSLRIHLSGFDVVYRPELVTYHYEHQTMNKKNNFKEYLYLRNFLLVLIENYPLKHIFNLFYSRLVAFFLRKTISIIKPGRVPIPKGGGGHNFPKKYFLKSFLFLVINSPKILIKRHGNKLGKRSMNYLISLNKKLKEDLRICAPFKHLIFSSTNMCNARCKMCFQWRDKKASKNLLSTEEAKEMLGSFKELENVVLSGGEPFMRPDLVELCDTLIKNSNPIITIPTNGSMSNAIYNKVKEILGLGCKRLTISMSLDGLEKYHDENRVFPGLFKKVYETYRLLSRIEDKRFSIQINTAVSRDNIKELPVLHSYIKNKMPKATWFFEPIRGTFNQETATAISEKNWDELYSLILKLNHAHKLKKYAQLRKLYKYSMASLRKGRQVVPCMGGEEMISIDYFGNIYPCEILPSVTNIKKIDYNINNLLINENWLRAVKNIKENKCYCTHFCWLGYSMNRKNLYNRLLDKYLR